MLAGRQRHFTTDTVCDKARKIVRKIKLKRALRMAAQKIQREGAVDNYSSTENNRIQDK